MSDTVNTVPALAWHKLIMLLIQSTVGVSYSAGRRGGRRGSLVTCPAAPGTLLDTHAVMWKAKAKGLAFQ